MKELAIDRKYRITTTTPTLTREEGEDFLYFITGQDTGTGIDFNM